MRQVEAEMSNNYAGIKINGEEMWDLLRRRYSITRRYNNRNRTSFIIAKKTSRRKSSNDEHKKLKSWNLKAVLIKQASL